jgi:hypothetical protein
MLPLRFGANFTVLPVDTGNATVVLNTEDYIRKIATLLEDPAHILVKDPTEAVERKTFTQSSMFSLSEEFAELARGDLGSTNSGKQAVKKSP